MNPKRKAIFFNDNEQSVRLVFGQGRWERVAELTDLHPFIIGIRNLDENRDAVRSAEVRDQRARMG